MGLAEKRMLAQLRDEVVPKYQAELQEITGSPLTYEIDWDTFSASMDAMGNLEEKALQPMNAIFRDITVDQIGKDAVRESIQRVRLTQKDDSTSLYDFTLTGGELHITYDWAGWPGSFYPETVQENIEKML